MSPIRDFVSNLAVGGHNASEILSKVERTFGIGAMSKSQIYRIIFEVKSRANMRDKRANNPKKIVRTPEVIASVEALIASDRRITEAEIKEETGLSHKTVHKILLEDL